jgi:hypothetical protein
MRASNVKTPDSMLPVYEHKDVHGSVRVMKVHLWYQSH